MAAATAAEGIQHPQPVQSRSNNFMRDEQLEGMNYQYYSQPYRPQGMFAPLPPSEQQNTLRHRQSSSNDALRSFGPGSQSLLDTNVQQSAPQELYSTATSNSHEAFQFSRNPNGQEFEFASNLMQNSSIQINGPVMSLNLPPQSQVPPHISNGSAQFNIVQQQQTTSFSNSSGMSSHPSHTTGPGPLPTSPGMASPTSSTIIQPQLMQMFPSHPSSGIQVQANSRSHQSPPHPGTQQNSQLPHLMQNLSLGVNPQSKGSNLGPPIGIPPPAPPQSGSGQLQGISHEEISTIFVVGFPDDMTEREFQNMFTFCSGYEAATLKVPTKEPSVQPPQNSAVAAAASALAGANDPYNLVTMNSGGVVVDQGNNTAATTSSMWASGLEDPYTRQVLAAAAATSSTSTSELAQQIALAQQNQPRKQIIGFAKFRSREDALRAKDVLHGKKVDVEKNAQLKAEMAKKNLHTKRGVGPLPAGAPNGPQSGSGPTDNMGPVSVFGPGAVSGNMLSQPAPQMLQGDQVLNAPPRGFGTSPNDGSQNGQQSSPPQIHNSPTFKFQRVHDIPPFIPSGGMIGNYPGTDTTSFYQPAFHRNELPQGLRDPPPILSPHGNPPEGFHALPNKPISDVVKANALPPTNLPPPTLPPLIIGQQKPTFMQKDSPPSLSNPSGSDAGYISDAPSTSRRSQRSRSASVSRYGGRASSPFQDESHPHIPSHILQDLGTPQQTDFPSKRLEDTPIGYSEHTSAQAFSPGFNAPAGVVESSASSNAGSVSSGGAESMTTSTTSGNGGNGKHGQENHHHANSTIASRRGVINGATVEVPRTNHENRGRSNAADQNPPINTLYVGNLPTSMPSAQSSKILEDALTNLFSTCPGYRKLSFKQKNNGTMCFVEFEDVPSASKGLNDLYGNTLNGLVKGGGIRLSYSKNPLGVRNSAPNSSSSSNGITSPIHSPTSHNPIQFGNVPPSLQEPFNLGRPAMANSMANSMAKPLDMPRGRPRQDTGELMMGMGSPAGRFGPSSPPQTTPVTAAFNAPNKVHSSFGRNPNVAGGQHYATASSPPVTSPINISYQPSSTFQPFVKPEMTRDFGRTSQDSDPNA